MGELEQMPQDWEARYREGDVEDMPWFYPELDPDVAAALSELQINGGRVLDLGTGPGTQAIALAEMGFEVTGSDLASSAIAKAQARGKAAGSSVRFQQDDILDSGLTGPFDLIFDRGCLHCLPPESWPVYVNTIQRILTPNGHLLVKCFSHLETREEGPPNRFSPDNIRSIFEPEMCVQSIRPAKYQGTMDEEPKAMFCIIRQGTTPGEKP
ncbi:MAG: class I SAM-dependent methyltransferase [Mariprofundaceae bacterium]